MKRRASEWRPRLSSWIMYWIWCILGIFLVVALVLFFVQHYQLIPRQLPMEVKSTRLDDVSVERMNFTEDLLSSTSLTRQLVDQMTLSKAYLVLAKEHGNFDFAAELSSQIRTCQRLLSQAAVSGKHITLMDAQPIVIQLSKSINKALDYHFDISTTISTLRNHVQALEDRVIVATAQSAAFGRLAAESMPKNLQCINFKLTKDWHQEQPALRLRAEEQQDSLRLIDINLYHFCVFSDNVLATSVVVNSTIANVQHPQQLVFHVVTDNINYQAMTAWFLKNNFKGCTVVVRRVEEFSWLNESSSPLVKQLARAETRSPHSLLKYLRFYIPETHPLLERVVVLDDDIVVQRDLTPLFSMNMHGSAIGAVETCLDSFHRLHNHVNFSHPLISATFDPQACAWAFGLNVVDLIAWKKANVTARFHYWVQQNADGLIWEGTLPAGLLAFYGLMVPLDRRWHVLGLGYDFQIDFRLIESAATLHFNGNMKPWLKLGISRYRHLWWRHIDFLHPYIRGCMLHS
ncbi:probable galacturonosyltransferase 11 [Phalaenopsis equestris]|uniref:probable galacturonosyltransferase 11 n=1 Tax=Phalaenopsis equestris TaxID=78828 RepID=UPI0009E5FC09|nr:probable galacturonosyltransferase 11 [Phalaenopsis equestris]